MASSGWEAGAGVGVTGAGAGAARVVGGLRRASAVVWKPGPTRRAPGSRLAISGSSGAHSRTTGRIGSTPMLTGLGMRSPRKRPEHGSSQ